MADPLRTSSHFLTALQALIDADDGAAVLAELFDERVRQAAVVSGEAEPWTLNSAAAELQARPHGAGLLGAMRLLVGAQPDKAAPGYSRRAEDDAVRVDQTLLLGHATSEVDAVWPGDGGGRPRLQQSALGLLGPNGAMPYRWTEFAHDMANTRLPTDRDSSFHAWLNVVQRRQIGLLYRAWSDARIETSGDRPQLGHPLADRLRALAGALLNGLRDRDDIGDAFKMAFGAALSRRVRNPGALAAMVAYYFGTEVAIEEFAPQWLDIPSDQRSALGLRFSTLGEDVVAGFRVWDATTRFRIIVGPLPLAAYRRFLPGGASHEALRDLVSLYVGAEHQWELVPVLKKSEVPVSRAGSAELLLGWSSWLGVRQDDVDAKDLVMPMAPRLGEVGLSNSAPPMPASRTE